MEINNHIIFSNEKAPELVNYLQKYSIPYEEEQHILVLDILQSNPNWEAVHRYVQKYKLICLYDTRFSTEELNAAQWMTVRSKWRNGYPQPEGKFAYEEITYTGDHCKTCGIGLQQKNPFRIKAAPKWGKRHFMMLNWVLDELFVDDLAKKMLIEHGFSGFRFEEVHNKNGTIILDNIHQLRIHGECKSGFVSNRSSIQNIYTCAICGQTKYHPSGMGKHAFQKHALDNMPDICRSFESFGWGRGADRLIIIRQSVYRAIVANRMDRGLVFSPIDLV